MKKLLLCNILNPIMNDETCFPHLGLGYLAAVIKKELPNQFEIKIEDRNLEEVIKEWEPNIVGITTTSQYFNRAQEIAQFSKEHGADTIIGGVHISALPQTRIAAFDAIVIGEGELIFPDIIRDKVHSGIYTGQTVDNLDNLPLPARELMEINKSTSMFTSRGCPYSCQYCCSSRYWGKPRLFSAEYVVNEIETLYNQYGVRDISLLDDLFIINKKRLVEIIQLLGRKSLLGKITYVCNVRSNLVNDELAKVLKFMNVRLVGMGIESGCQRTLEWLKGKWNITVEDHVNAIEILRKNNIHIHPSFIIGSPYETRKDALETLRFIRENNIKDFEIYVLNPLPGTPVWQIAKDQGVVQERYNWNWYRLYWNFHLNKNPVIVSKTMTNEEIIDLHKIFMKERKDLNPSIIDKIVTYSKMLTRR